MAKIDKTAITIINSTRENPSSLGMSKNLFKLKKPFKGYNCKTMLNL